MPTRQHDLDKLADALAGALPSLDPDGERPAIALYRHLATRGSAATDELAAATGLPAQAVAATLGSWPAVFTGHRGGSPGSGAWRPASSRRRTGSRPVGGSYMRGAPGTPYSCPPGSARPRA